MRSPVVAVSLFAAAAVVSASTNGLPNSPDLGSNTLSPKLDLEGSGLKNNLHHRDAGPGAGLGISQSGASTPHQKRTPARQHSNNAEVEARPAEHAPAPPPRPQRPITGGATGCDDPSTTSEESVIANALNTGNENGGVSCSSSVKGASADSGGQDSGPDANSSDAGPTDGSDVLNQDLDGVLNQGQDGGTSVSESVNGDNANTAPVAASYGTGTYPGYGGTRTTPQVPRGLSTLTPQDAQKSLYELVNGTTRGVSTRNLQREDSSDGTLLDDADPDLNGAPGESIYGDAIPGSGPNGGHAYPGKPGPSDGGRVIESGNVEDNGSNTPGAGGLSRSGTASGGNGRT